jgi:hypothetical protein
MHRIYIYGLVEFTEQKMSGRLVCMEERGLDRIRMLLQTG